MTKIKGRKIGTGVIISRKVSYGGEIEMTSGSEKGTIHYVLESGLMGAKGKCQLGTVGRIYNDKENLQFHPNS